MFGILADVMRRATLTAEDLPQADRGDWRPPLHWRETHRALRREAEQRGRAGD